MSLESQSNPNLLLRHFCYLKFLKHSKNFKEKRSLLIQTTPDDGL